MLHNLAIGHKDHLVCRFPGEAHLMGDNQHGVLLARSRITSRTSPTRLGSKAAVGSIKEYDLGLYSHSPGNTNPLLLATREAWRDTRFFVQ